MGLSICRSIITAHGGRLWAEANRPRGAIFQFTLPAAQKEFMNFFVRLARIESRTKAAFEMVVIHRLAEITDHSILQGAVPTASSGYAVTRIVGIAWPALMRCL